LREQENQRRHRSTKVAAPGSVAIHKMIDGNEKQNFQTLMRLRDLLVEGAKPLVFWVGAGASRWCAYPGWDDLARHFHATFSRSERTYRKEIGLAHLTGGHYPALFSNCKKANETLYNSLLISAFPPVVRPSAVYENFLNHLSTFTPLQIITTNVDEALEQRLPACTIVPTDRF